MLKSKSQTVTDAALVAMFKALGDPTRLRIFQFLRASCAPVTLDEKGDVRACCGPTVGEVCCNVTGADKITSGVSFHIKELRIAGLITVERRGKTMICDLNREAAARLAAFLSEPSATKGTDDECSGATGIVPRGEPSEFHHVTLKTA